MRMFVVYLALLLCAVAAHAQPASLHPKLISIEVEEAPGTYNRSFLRVTIAEPLEEAELHQITALLRSQARNVNMFGVRFVLPGWPGGDRDPDGGAPFYAWKLMKTGQQDTFTMHGVSFSYQRTK